VALQYKYTAPTTSELDPYLSLIEAIADSFERQQLSNGAVCLKVEHPHLMYDRHMQEFRVFTSVVTLTLTRTIDS
jgi:hypothetical protein